jgi:hypothetical protein
LVKDAVKIPRIIKKLEDTLEEKLSKEYDKKQKLKSSGGSGMDMDLFPEK